MARRATGWTCRRSSGGAKCLRHNTPGTRKCVACGKPRPVKKQPAHRAVLKVPYERWLAALGLVEGEESCMICGAPRGEKRFHRDHDHHTGRARGVLCWPCNSTLNTRITPEWLTKAAEYLRRPPLDLEA